MTKTTKIASAVTANGNTAPIQVESGQHFLAVGGTFGNATVALMANVADVVVPITDVSYTAPGSDIVWLPTCTIFLAISGATGTTAISAAIADAITTVK
jgi:hypothetical protein